MIFFASKGDNRVWAIDIENSLIELIYDTQNNQAFTNLRNIGGTPSNFNQVDNVRRQPRAATCWSPRTAPPCAWRSCSTTSRPSC